MSPISGVKGQVYLDQTFFINSPYVTNYLLVNVHINIFILSLVLNDSQLNQLDLSLPPGFEVAWTPDGRKYYIE